MIARIWRGKTPATKAEEYFEYLKKTGIKDYQSVKGNRGVFVLRQVTTVEAEFLLISLWDSLEAIKSFAGEDHEKARYYPEDRQFLLGFEPNVVHYEVLQKP